MYSFIVLDLSFALLKQKKKEYIKTNSSKVGNMWITKKTRTHIYDPVLILSQNQEYIYAITKNATTYEQLMSTMSLIQT